MCDRVKTRRSNSEFGVASLVLERLKDILESFQDIWNYMRVEKKFWLAPIIIILLVVGALIVVVEGTAVAPFLYAVF